MNVLLLLQTRSRMTAAELAGELEVSVRTIYRDVEALAEAGVPIYAERGPHGGVRLVDGYRTRLTGLTPDEAEAVFLSGLPGPAAELGLGTVVAAARLKVMAALPPDLRTRANRVSERFHLDAPGWFQQSEELPYLETLAGAVWESFLVLITYRRGERAGVVERLVEPLGLVLKGGVWYLVARTGESMRTYRVSRVLDVRVQPERFERPAGFDLAEHWTRSTLAYERDRERVWVTIRVGKEHSGRIEETIDDKFLADAEWLTEPDSAHIRVRIGFDWTDEAVTAAMRLGSDAEVVEPEWVRTTVVSSAEAVLDRYRGLSVAGRG